MINYSNVNLKQAGDEIINRLNYYRNGYNIDWWSLINIINMSIAETVSIILPLYANNYIRSVAIQNGSFLGPNFIKQQRVLLRNQPDKPMREARYVSAKEFNSVTDWEDPQVWNKATEDNPIYTIYGLIIYTAGRIISDDDIITADTSDGILEGYYYPNIISLDSDIIPIPYDYIELFYSLCLSKLLMNSDVEKGLEYLMGNIQKIKNELYQRKTEKEKAEARTLDSFVEPTVPYVPEQQTTGGVPPRL